MIVSAQVLADGIEQSTVRIDDQVWTQYEHAMKVAASNRGYQLNVKEGVESGEIERNIGSLGEFDEWMNTLNPDED